MNRLRRLSQDSFEKKKDPRSRTAEGAGRKMRVKRTIGNATTICVPEPTASPFGAKFHDSYDKPYMQDFVIRRQAKIEAEMRSKPFCQKFYLPEARSPVIEGILPSPKAEVATGEVKGTRRQRGTAINLKVGSESDWKFRTIQGAEIGTASQTPNNLGF